MLRLNEKTIWSESAELRIRKKFGKYNARLQNKHFKKMAILSNFLMSYVPDDHEVVPLDL